MPVLDRKRIGRNLKRARVRAGISITDAAAFLRVNRLSIYRWETGRSMPDADYYLQLMEWYAPDDDPVSDDVSSAASG